MSQSRHHHDAMRVPPALLAGAGALIAASIIVVAFATHTNIGVQQEPVIEKVESVMLVFRDEADGGVGVYDFSSGEQVHVFAPETGGFVRSAMRAVAHDRKVSGGSPEAPFELARTVEGRLLLTDTLTGKRLTLEAFGAVNEADFAQLLPSEKAGHDD